MKIYETLKKNNVSFDHIDLLSIKPLDIKAIFRSVKKTGKLLILDNSSHSFCSVSSEIVSQLTAINPKVFKTIDSKSSRDSFSLKFLFNKRVLSI